VFERVIPPSPGRQRPVSVSPRMQRQADLAHLNGIGGGRVESSAAAGLSSAVPGRVAALAQDTGMAVP